MSLKVLSNPAHSRILQGRGLGLSHHTPRTQLQLSFVQWEEHHLQEVTQASVAAWDTRAMLVNQEPQLHDTDPGLKTCFKCSLLETASFTLMAGSRWHN